MTLIELAARLKVRMLARLRSSGDREHETPGNRLGVSTIVGIRFLLALPNGRAEDHRLRALRLGCCVEALLLAACPLLKPKPPKMWSLVRGSALNQPRTFQTPCSALAEQR